MPFFYHKVQVVLLFFFFFFISCIYFRCDGIEDHFFVFVFQRSTKVEYTVCAVGVGSFLGVGGLTFWIHCTCFEGCQDICFSLFKWGFGLLRLWIHDKVFLSLVNSTASEYQSFHAVIPSSQLLGSQAWPDFMKDFIHCGHIRTNISSTLQTDFPPDLCSRVTFVNFTVTRSSLQSQCLNQVSKHLPRSCGCWLSIALCPHYATSASYLFKVHVICWLYSPHTEILNCSLRRGEPVLKWGNVWF